jgi:uncharacterized protein (TIGR03382 family)
MVGLLLTGLAVSHAQSHTGASDTGTSHTGAWTQHTGVTLPPPDSGDSGGSGTGGTTDTPTDTTETTDTTDDPVTDLTTDDTGSKDDNGTCGGCQTQSPAGLGASSGLILTGILALRRRRPCVTAGL